LAVSGVRNTSLSNNYLGNSESAAASDTNAEWPPWSGTAPERRLGFALLLIGNCPAITWRAGADFHHIFTGTTAPL
jgi:hypothetical protein